MSFRDEIRPGNWLLYIEASGDPEWEVRLVDAGDPAEVATALAHFTAVPWERLHPLPLFYWHLEWAEFEKLAEDVYEKDGWRVDIEAAQVHWNNQVFNGIRYVHQLQNLVHAHSGHDIDFHHMGTDR